jgi:hypothetical protein
MTDEVLAELPASEPVATAAPEPEVTQPEAAPKTFTQEDLDAAISKRLAREQRKWERESALRSAPAPLVDPPKPEQFNNTEAYADALAERKAEELLQRREMERQQRETLDAYHEREEDARTKYDDFEQVAYNPALPITTVMAQTIQASDIGPELAYYLGANPKEAERISRLAPFLQAKEIGKVEAKLADNPPVKRSSTAPSPISPVSAKSSGSPSYDTTDPRSVKSMSTSEWIAADRARQIKKMEASNKFR